MATPQEDHARGQRDGATASQLDAFAVTNNPLLSEHYKAGFFHAFNQHPRSPRPDPSTATPSRRPSYDSGGKYSGLTDSGGCLETVGCMMMGLLLLAVALFFLEAYCGTPRPAIQPLYPPPDPHNPATVIVEDFAGPLTADFNGVGIAVAPWARWAVFSQTQETRLQYSFERGFPREGTLEFLVRVDSGYTYSDRTIAVNHDLALLFTTDIAGGDVSWPGSAWLWVRSDGRIAFNLVTARGQSPPALSLVAPRSRFRFREWHRLGISFGSQGQYIMIDGELVAADPSATQPLGAGGSLQAPLDRPTIGESVSSVWPNNTHEGGFDGGLQAFRASSTQLDWSWTRDTTSFDPEKPVLRP